MLSFTSLCIYSSQLRPLPTTSAQLEFTWKLTLDVLAVSKYNPSITLYIPISPVLRYVHQIYELSKPLNSLKDLRGNRVISCFISLDLSYVDVFKFKIARYCIASAIGRDDSQICLPKVAKHCQALSVIRLPARTLGQSKYIQRIYM